MFKNKEGCCVPLDLFTNVLSASRQNPRTILIGKFSQRFRIRMNVGVYTHCWCNVCKLHKMSVFLMCLIVEWWLSIYRFPSWLSIKDLAGTVLSFAKPTLAAVKSFFSWKKCRLLPFLWAFGFFEAPHQTSNYITSTTHFEPNWRWKWVDSLVTHYLCISWWFQYNPVNKSGGKLMITLVYLKVGLVNYGMGWFWLQSEFPPT